MDRSAQLLNLARRARASQAKARKDTAERNALIYDMAVNGEQTQSGICRLVDLTREQVRRIVDAEQKRRDTEAHDATAGSENDHTRP